eukprot:TRINITY_DN2303_c0_g1_i1.p1 TRINITY_DN2303_c0_g1~~TRINITY_DN2303_c0_g1_i1.p1  ORF type:complete len:746 (-),score=135.70 TRINITY_DN2303_c0_g1_i1:141-2198(-)
MTASATAAAFAQFSAGSASLRASSGSPTPQPHHHHHRHPHQMPHQAGHPLAHAGAQPGALHHPGHHVAMAGASHSSAAHSPRPHHPYGVGYHPGYHQAPPQHGFVGHPGHHHPRPGHHGYLPYHPGMAQQHHGRHRSPERAVANGQADELPQFGRQQQQQQQQAAAASSERRRRNGYDPDRGTAGSLESILYDFQRAMDKKKLEGGDRRELCDLNVPMNALNIPRSLGGAASSEDCSPLSPRVIEGALTVRSPRSLSPNRTPRGEAALPSLKAAAAVVAGGGNLGGLYTLDALGRKGLGSRSASLSRIPLAIPGTPTSLGSSMRDLSPSSSSLALNRWRRSLGRPQRGAASSVCSEQASFSRSESVRSLALSSMATGSVTNGPSASSSLANASLNATLASLTQSQGGTPRNATRQASSAAQSNGSSRMESANSAQLRSTRERRDRRERSLSQSSAVVASGTRTSSRQPSPAVTPPISPSTSEQVVQAAAATSSQNSYDAKQNALVNYLQSCKANQKRREGSVEGGSTMGNRAASTTEGEPELASATTLTAGEATDASPAILSDASPAGPSSQLKASAVRVRPPAVMPTGSAAPLPPDASAGQGDVSADKVDASPIAELVVEAKDIGAAAKPSEGGGGAGAVAVGGMIATSAGPKRPKPISWRTQQAAGNGAAGTAASPPLVVASG